MLAASILGRSGPSSEDPCRISITCLDYFASADPHARQYELISQTLLEATSKHAQERQVTQKRRRREATSQLFGLLPAENVSANSDSIVSPVTQPQQPAASQPNTGGSGMDTNWSIYDADFFTNSLFQQTVDPGLQDFLQPARLGGDGSLADIPLFPMNEDWSFG